MVEEKYRHFRLLENMYHGAPINHVIQHKLEVDEGSARLNWVVSEDMFHAGGALHGSMYFKMLDDAAFFSANSLEREFFVVTAAFNILLLRPVFGGTLEASGKVISHGKTLIFAESVLHDQKGREIARGSGTFAKSRMQLTSVPAYS